MSKAGRSKASCITDNADIWSRLKWKMPIDMYLKFMYTICLNSNVVDSR